jgi:hypothetical protein
MMSERRRLILVAPAPTDDGHRVVRIRRRSAKTDGMARWRESIHHGDPNISTVLSLAKERDRQKDKYQHCMIMDGLALVFFTVALMAAGIWPAVNIHGFSLHPPLSGPP